MRRFLLFYNIIVLGFVGFLVAKSTGIDIISIIGAGMIIGVVITLNSSK